jgi:ribosomal protein S18 acetylase RimI-like enzyme
MKPRLTIRRYRKGDFDSYVDLLMLTSQKEYSDLGRPEVAAMLRHMDKNWIWVADINDDSAGFVTVQPEKGMLHVVWLDIFPDYQRCGIGSELLKTVILAGKNHGLGPVIVEVWDGNKQAMDFYYKEGFKKKKWYVDYYGNGLSAYEMVKDI